MRRPPGRRLTVALALLLVMLFSLVLHLTFWHFPLLVLDALTTPEQDERFSDQNFYLFSAAQICLQGTWTAEDLMVTWSSIGVTGYLVGGCRMLGTEFFYIVFNPILVAVGLGLTLAVARSCGIQPRISPLSVFAVPYTLLTISMPGKEVISVFGSLMVASGLLVISAKNLWLRGLVLALPGLAIVAFSRPHEAVAITLFCALWLSSSHSAWTRLAVPIALFFAVASLAPTLLTALQLSAAADTLTDESMWSGSSAGKAYDASGLFDALRSDNLLIHALLGVPRVALVLAAPLSSFLTPWSDVDPAYFLFRDLSQRLRLIDMAFVFVAFIGALRTPFLALAPAAAKTRWLLPAFFLFMIYTITFFGVSQKSRYVFQYVPLILVWYWCWQPVSKFTYGLKPKGSKSASACKSKPF